MVAEPHSNLTQIECRAALEDITHLTRKICGIWGTPELDTFLSGLLMDARDGARQGLPMAAAGEIVFLAQINKMVRAMDLTRTLNIRIEETYRLVDEGDQARLKIDALDDPLVSRDTVTRPGRLTEVSARRPATLSAGSQAKGLGELLLMLIRSKWLAWAVILVLSVKLLWPVVKNLIQGLLQ